MAKDPDLLEIKSENKLGAIQEVANYFLSRDYKIVDADVLRPWGFYFYFDPIQTSKFSSEFFADVKLRGIDTSLPLQPKVLVFEPNKRLSWQYHNRRAEIWRCITKQCLVTTSLTDQADSPRLIKFGEVVNFTQGTRHRGCGTDEWGAVAEIWQHTDPNNPSNETDIVRLQDDFGR
jgi:mannose-6-phosphate isomerase-like protein (cupin superfamily)